MTNTALSEKRSGNPTLDSGRRPIRRQSPRKILCIEIECPRPGCSGMARAPRDAAKTRFCAGCQAEMRKHAATVLLERGIRLSDREMVAWLLRDAECPWCGGSWRNGRPAVLLDKHDNGVICEECASVPGPDDD